ncbi:hypothetical protein SPRG_03765 [Saprolegnia parasitica CBS 223.65]|uniref:Ion transport domain-containing protein n=1 Tax=Saprolegnia parasitica (strain CBS 223.65) TaxID=695850 RepID=A0A067CRH3_SAPPC|nr:hypothetical protein SPRG_03765 [Saprolegnia parasitica CBS 223.65]KDO31845.1 hypothetical protein SPRG_03765 [Saprolegnia parasitica CBS 223.65]|eukprot:XP_012197724.1 hypothetical protein SPRG_03765 [Saprolegnia parasitica CBS 223.65]
MMMDAELNALDEDALVRRVLGDDHGGDLTGYKSPQTKQTLLHLAAGRGYERLTRALLAKHVELNDQDDGGKTALVVAVLSANIAIFRLLVDANADVHITTSEGYSAFYIAARTNQAAMAQVLLPRLHDGGARELLAALHDASPDDAVRCLLHAGLSPPIFHAVLDRPSLLRVFVAHDPAIVHLKDRYGRTALARTASSGNLDACRLLLQFGASLEAKDHRGRSVVYLAACHEQGSVLQLFAAETTSVALLVTSKDDEHRTPLHVLAERGSLRGCKLACKYHAKLDAADMDGATPLHIAASLGHADLCRFFAKRDDLDCNDALVYRHASASWLVVTTRRLLTIYSELFDLGVPATLAAYGSLRVRDFEMNTLLHMAAQHVSDVHADYLLNALHRTGKIPINVLNCYGKTPLEMAQHACSTSVLRAMGSNDMLRTLDSATALHEDDDWTLCAPAKLRLLVSEIMEGYCYLGDPATLVVCSDSGDTILHALLDAIEAMTPRPTDAHQEEMLLGPNWLASPHIGVVAQLLGKPNWTGLAPLHKAAAIGALGACRALVHRGADAASSVGDRLKRPSALCTTGWHAVNFAASLSSDAVLRYFLATPSALPTAPSAVAQLKSTVTSQHPSLLPTLLARLDDASTTTPAVLEAIARCDAFYHPEGLPVDDASALLVFHIVVEADRCGVEALWHVVCADCIVRSTGDTLLHIFAADTARDRTPELTYLLTTAKMDVDTLNKRGQTALHVACERHLPGICAYLLSRGADVRRSCRNAPHWMGTSSIVDRGISDSRLLRPTLDDGSDISMMTDEAWQTPLHICLGQTLRRLSSSQIQANNAVVELLLQHPASLVEPSASVPASSSASCAWNRAAFDRIVTDFDFALPAYLDHFVQVKHWHGTTTYRFQCVRDVCRNLDRIMATTGETGRVLLHPTVRNALRAKWHLFGRRMYRKELCLSALLLACFTISNYTLVADETPTRRLWPDDVVVVGFKGLTWLLALYHLLYVEMWQEMRLDASAYWTSLWNYIHIASYLLLLLSIPMDALDVHTSIKESCLSVASILLLFGLLQGLLVFSYFSVLLFTFSRMLKVALKFCLLYAILLVGFTAAFYLVFHGVAGHTSLRETFVTVFLIMFGELNFHDVYGATTNSVRYTAGLLVLVTYLLCVNIVGLNMLIAMMTAEYDSIKSQAQVLAVKELANTLHRYEAWLGPASVERLYASETLGSFASYAEAATTISRPADDGKTTSQAENLNLQAELQQLAGRLHELSSDVRGSVAKVLRLEEVVHEHVTAQHELLASILEHLQRPSAT